MEHDSYFEEGYTKKQLLEILHTRTFEKEFVVDMIAQKYYHTVVRLPPYFCIFNPIELMWAQLKKRIR
jgi:transposase